MNFHVGSKLKEKHVAQVKEALEGALPPDERITAMFWANGLRPILDTIVVTDSRIIGVSRPDLARGNGLRKEIAGSEIMSASVETRLGATALKIARSGGKAEAYATVQRGDAETLERFVAAASGSPAPLADTREAQRREVANGTEALRKLVVGSVSAKTLEEVWGNCRDGELPEFIAGEPASAAGSLTAFSDRCLVIKKGAWTGFMAGAMGGGRVATFMYVNITGIEYNAGWINGVLEILTPSYQGSTNKDFWRGTFSGRNENADDPFTLSNTLPWTKPFYEQVRPKIEWMKHQVAESRRPAAYAQQGSAQPALAAEIAKLASLHQEGVLDDEEFRQAKQALLAQSG